MNAWLRRFAPAGLLAASLGVAAPATTHRSEIDNAALSNEGDGINYAVYGRTFSGQELISPEKFSRVI
jgi:hypothetical protein